MSKQNIPQETIDKIKEYVTKNFSNTFKNKPIIIVEKETHFTVTPHKDFGPIILSKNILK
tara:strand:+ start:281 stop:460 length:180 start_codon:yes stop_codon:yes gene_type:complete